jgi:hypothetical protein
MSDHPTEDRRTWWTIDITGYGTFTVFATEAEADQKRRDKAEWEGGRGRKRAADADEIAEAKEHIRWKQANEYPMEPEELEALKS